MRFVVWIALLSACEQHPKNTGPSGGAPSGLPSGEAPLPSGPSGPSGSSKAGAAADPHAGLGMEMGGEGGDPHAGLDLEGSGANPHGGMAPEGGRTPAVSFDPSMVLAGTIDVPAKLKPQVKPGDIVFISVKSVDASGTPQRIPIAVDRVDVGTLPASFSLSGKNTMMPGTKFEGNVLITVRVDRDGEATTRAKGDLEGTVRATIPARELKILLDTPVP